MALTDNYGTQYYGISCGIPSDAGLNVNSNSGTKYYRNSANEFILWGQANQYTHVQANTGSQFYFLKCDVPSDAGVNLTRNHGTNYYYSSAFNCVSFCDPLNFSSSESNGPILFQSIYVDSIYGNDYALGYINSPLATLSAARLAIIARPENQNYRKVFLKRGSTFRESYEIPNNSYLGSYGSGDKPIISGCSILLSSGWVKTVGQSNVYQYAISPNAETNTYAAVTHSNVLMVWDNGSRIGTQATIKTSVSSVDLSANSWYYDNTSKILYVRTVDDTSPGVNGRTYEASVRTLALHGGDGVLVEDVQTDGVYTRTTTGQQGYGILGYKSGTYRRCKATRGWNHIIGVANEESGTLIFDSCMAYDAEQISSIPATLYVGYSGGVSAPRDVIFKNCVAKQPTPYTSIQTTGFYGHGTRCNIIYDNCSSENCFYGLQTWNSDPGATGTTRVYTGFTAVSCNQAILANYGGITSLSGLTFKNCATGINVGVNMTINVSNMKTVDCNAAIANYRGLNYNILLRDSIIARQSIPLGFNDGNGLQTAPGGTFGKSMSVNNIFHNIGAVFNGGVLSGTDYNQYSGVVRIASDCQFAPGYFTSLPTWKSSSSLDANSTANPWTPPVNFFDVVINDPTL